MNSVICTICCAEKKDSKEKLPAIDLYLSSRIRFAYKESQEKGVGFRIFSGKYGLLKPDQPIDWYDFQLTNETVSDIVPVMVSQIKEQAIEKVIFYARPKSTPGWEAYYKALEQASKTTGIKFEVITPQEFTNGSV